ncbi:hypothetical protein KAT82_02880 [bacterium]|nr:hypothetical protein [bacterium]
MPKMEFECQACGYRFVRDIVDEEEARRRKLPRQPMYYPKCHAPARRVG